jgi:copper chaperone
MSCSGCVSSVTRSLQAVPGVEAVKVSLDDASAKVTYDAALTGVPELKLAVERAGFDAP